MSINNLWIRYSTKLDRFSVSMKAGLLLCIISASWLLEIANANFGEFPISEYALLVLYSIIITGIVLLIGVLPCYFIRKISKFYKAADYLFLFYCATILSFLFFSLVLCLSEWYFTWGISTRVTIIMFFLLFAPLFLTCLKQGKKIYALLLVAGGLNFFIINVSIAYQFVSPAKPNTKMITNMGRLPPAQAINFLKKPNVYLLSFDSLMSTQAMKKIFKASKANYISQLKQFNFKIVNNGLSTLVPTTLSLNSLVAIDLEHYKKMDKLLHFFVTNRTVTPLYNYFRHNDYKIRFGYAGDFFGAGHQLDDYITTSNMISICGLPLNKRAMLFFCEQIKTLSKQYPHLYNKITNQKQHKTNWNERYIQAISKDHQTQQNWLNYAYIYSPGHTAKDFDIREKENLKKYQEKFFASEKHTTEIIRRFVTSIEKQDPDSIIIIFGDHGPFTTRMLKRNNPITDEAFWVLDRHGVTIAYKTPSYCTAYFDGLRFVADIGIRLINCLNQTQAIPNQLNQAENQKILASEIQ